ncbi:MAG: hypothetical protein M3P94_05590 [Chloroflexota bacterium]|nr:hypothetical protein [Chloroflexota bacterium]
MDDPTWQRTNSNADLDEWVAEGLIGPAQAASIRSRTDRRDHLRDPVAFVIPGAGGELHGTLPGDTPAAGTKSSPGERLQQIAYYIGGFTILFAFTIFVGLGWEDLADPTRLTIVVVTMATLTAIGIALRRAGALTGGNVLVFGATGLTPLLTFEILKVTGLWDGGEDAETYRSFFRRVDESWLILEIVSIAVAIIVVGWIRFPLVTLLIAFWSYYLSLDVAEAFWADGPTGEQRSLVFAGVGLLMIIVGTDLHRRDLRPYAFWFWLFGLIGAQGGVGAFALQNDRDIWAGLGFLTLSMAWIVMSVWLSSTSFLVFGALGCYAYVSYLAFDIFDGALGFVVTLGAVGLFIILTTFSYQRFLGPWLRRAVRPHRSAAA